MFQIAEGRFEPEVGNTDRSKQIAGSFIIAKEFRCGFCALTPHLSCSFSKFGLPFPKIWFSHSVFVFSLTIFRSFDSALLAAALPPDSWRISNFSVREGKTLQLGSDPLPTAVRLLSFIWKELCGFGLYRVSTGLQLKGSSPTVVFSNGMKMNQLLWSPVRPKLAIPLQNVVKSRDSKEWD